MAVWGGLTNSCEKKRSEKQRFVNDTEKFAALDTDTKALVEGWASKFNG